MEVDHHPATVITGAGSGIGRATALMLAMEGHHLALVGRTGSKLEETEKLIQAKLHDGARTVIVPADVGDPHAPAVIVDHALRAFGRVDALVNNAGVGPYKPIAETDEDDLHHTFEVDLFGPIRLVARLWNVFLEQGGGCVVNVSSMATVDPFPGLSVYAAAKAGLESLTRSIHNEGSQQGIAAYSVAPGAVETDMLRGIFSTEVIAESQTLEPEDVARVVVDCVLGRREAEKGRTILVPSP